MSWWHLSDETRKARKRYMCEVCGQTICVGESHVARTGASDGTVSTFRMHPECKELSKDWDDMDWECHFPGDVSRPGEWAKEGQG